MSVVIEMQDIKRNIQNDETLNPELHAVTHPEGPLQSVGDFVRRCNGRYEALVARNPHRGHLGSLIPAHFLQLVCTFSDFSWWQLILHAAVSIDFYFTSSLPLRQLLVAAVSITMLAWGFSQLSTTFAALYGWHITVIITRSIMAWARYNHHVLRWFVTFLVHIEIAHALAHALPNTWLPVVIVYTIALLFYELHLHKRWPILSQLSLMDVVHALYLFIALGINKATHRKVGTMQSGELVLFPDTDYSGGALVRPLYEEWTSDPFYRWLCEQSDINYLPTHLAVFVAVTMIHWSAGLMYLIVLVTRVGIHYATRKAPEALPNYNHLIRAFRNAHIPIRTTDPETSGHSHPVAASTRDSVNFWMNEFISAQGLDIYSIQPSAKDVEAGFDYAHARHIGLDNHTLPSVSPVRPTTFFKMVNVDYYMRDLMDLLWYCKPVLLYTFTPIKPSGVACKGEYVWRARSDGSVECTVAGSTHYAHHLWQWETSSVEVSFGFYKVIYSCEVRKLHDDGNFAAVILVPRARGATWPFQYGCTVKRREFHVNSVTIRTLEDARAKNKTAIDAKSRLWFEAKPELTKCMVTHTIDTMLSPDQDHLVVMYVSPPDASISVPVTAKMHTLLLAASKSTVTIGSIASWVPSCYPQNYANGNNTLFANVLYSYWPLSGEMPSLMRVSGRVSKDVNKGYTLLEDESGASDKPAAVVLCKPLLGDIIAVPARSHANDKLCIAERVASVANTVRFSTHILRYQAEFIKFLFPYAGTLVPLEHSDVMETRRRPTHRARDPLTVLELYDDKQDEKICSFQKAESYDGFKAPRNISTIPDKLTIRYSRFTLSLAKHLKTFRWYAFGRDTAEIDALVRELCARHPVAMGETDYSRFDGTHSHSLYSLEKTVLLRAFPVAYHFELSKLHDTLRALPAKTSLGVRYDPGGSRPSGSADTSIGNTIDNAFMAYCYHRSMKLTKEQSWQALGIYGGDDGLTPLVVDDPDGKSYDASAKSFGVRLKVAVRPVGTNVGFLGRVHVNPWVAMDLPSFASAKRQLSKFHMYPIPDPQIMKVPMIAAIGKAMGFVTVDNNTPLIGDIGRTILRICTPEQFRQFTLRRITLDSLVAYTARSPTDMALAGTSSLIFQPGPVDQKIYDELFPHVAMDMGIDEGVLRNWVHDLLSVTSLADIPPIVEAAPVIPAGMRRGDDFSDGIFPVAPPAELPTVEEKRMVGGVDWTYHQDVERTSAIGTNKFRAQKRYEVMRNMLARIKTPKRIVDLTAHTGATALAARACFPHPRPSVVAIERDTATYGALVHNLANPAYKDGGGELLPVNANSTDIRFDDSDLVIFDPIWNDTYNGVDPLKYATRLARHTNVLFITSKETKIPNCTISIECGKAVKMTLFARSLAEKSALPIPPLPTHRTVRIAPGARPRVERKGPKPGANPNRRPRLPVPVRPPRRPPPPDSQPPPPLPVVVATPLPPIPAPTPPGVAPAPRVVDLGLGEAKRSSPS